MSPRPYPGRHPNPWHPTAVGPGPPPPAEGPCSQAVLSTHGWRLGAPRASAPFFPTDAPQPRGHRRCCPPQCPPLTSSVVSGMQMRYSLMSMVAGVRPRCGHWRGHSSFWGEPGDTVRAGGTGLAAASPTPSPSPHARGGCPVPSAGDFMSRCYGSSMRSLVRGAAWVYPAEDTPVPQNHPGINPFPARQTLTPLVSKHMCPPKIPCHPFRVPHPHPAPASSTARGLCGHQDGMRTCHWAPMLWPALGSCSQGASRSCSWCATALPWAGAGASTPGLPPAPIPTSLHPRAAPPAPILASGTAR